MGNYIAEALVRNRMKKRTDESSHDRIKLKYWTDTWNMIDKYGIEDWEDHDSYISISKDSYKKMLDGSKNKSYIRNLVLREDFANESREAPQEYLEKAEEILNHRLGNYETGVRVIRGELVNQGSNPVAIKVGYDVTVRIPIVDPEDHSTYYEEEVEYRTQTIVLEEDGLEESVSTPNFKGTKGDD